LDAPPNPADGPISNRGGLRAFGSVALKVRLDERSQHIQSFGDFFLVLFCLRIQASAIMISVFSGDKQY